MKRTWFQHFAQTKPSCGRAALCAAKLADFRIKQREPRIQPGLRRRSGHAATIGIMARSARRDVASGVPPDVEGVRPPPGMGHECLQTHGNLQRARFCVAFFPPGGTPGSTAGGTPAATPLPDSQNEWRFSAAWYTLRVFGLLKKSSPRTFRAGPFGIFLHELIATRRHGGHLAGHGRQGQAVRAAPVAPASCKSTSLARKRFLHGCEVLQKFHDHEGVIGYVEHGKIDGQLYLRHGIRGGREPQGTLRAARSGAAGKRGADHH